MKDKMNISDHSEAFGDTWKLLPDLNVAVNYADPSYVIGKNRDGKIELRELDEVLGAFDTYSQALVAMPQLEFDPWDGDGQSLHFLMLAPQNVREWVSGETDTVTLQKSQGRWWLNVPSEVGQSDYPTMLRAKIAGLELYKKSYEQSEAKVIASMEVDANDWKVEFINDAIVATNLHDASFTLSLVQNVGKWSVYEGDTLASEGHSTASAAAQSVPKPAMTL